MHLIFFRFHTSHFMTGYYIFLDNKTFEQVLNHLGIYVLTQNIISRCVHAMQNFKYFDAETCSTHPHNYAIQLLRDRFNWLHSIFDFLLLVDLYFYN